MTNNAFTSSAGNKPPDATEQRTAVRERYARIATESFWLSKDSHGSTHKLTNV